MEGRKFCSEDIRGGVKGVFGARMKVQVPDLEKAGGVLRSRRIFGVGRQEEFRELLVLCKLR